MNLKQTVFYSFARRIHTLIFGTYSRYFEPTKNKWSPEKRQRILQKLYEINMGHAFDIRHPVLFTEKIQWYKEFYRAEGLINVVDKYLFKEYVRSKLGDGYTIPLYGAWTDLKSFEDDYEKLPETFIIKSTLQGEGLFVKKINKKTVDFSKLKKELSEWLKLKNTYINSFCHAYHEGVPRILAEEYMEQVDNQLYDYKFHCFNGVPKFVLVCEDRDKKRMKKTFLDLDWNILPCYREEADVNPKVEKPKHYEKMIEIAEKLSAAFPFVRVDFFDTDENLYVAEMTLYPGGGFTHYHPESFDKELGDLFQLPEGY